MSLVSQLQAAFTRVAQEINTVRTEINISTVTKTTTYTLVTADDVVLADATSAPFTLTLPTAVGRTRPFYIKRINAGANAVTIDGAGSETIDGDLTAVLTVQHTAVTLISDGTNWRVF